MPDNSIPLGLLTVEVADSLNADGMGVWLGWHRIYNWVLLDRTHPANQNKRENVYYIRASDWSIYKESGRLWGNYLYYLQVIKRADISARKALVETIELICKQYQERACDLSMKIDYASTEMTDNAKKIEAERQQEEAELQAEERKFLEKNLLEDLIANVTLEVESFVSKHPELATLLGKEFTDNHFVSAISTSGGLNKIELDLIRRYGMVFATVWGMEEPPRKLSNNRKIDSSPKSLWNAYLLRRYSLLPGRRSGKVGYGGGEKPSSTERSSFGSPKGKYRSKLGCG